MKKLKVIFKLFFLIAFIIPTGFIYAQGQDSQIIESLEFRNLDIKDVLRQLSKQYNLNIVFSESVTGLVTVQLTNVDIQQALDSIITVNGFAYTRKDNVYKVTTPEEAEREGKMTKLFRLNNADAEKLKNTFKNVLTADGSIEADVRSNSIIITDVPGVINKVEGMLPDLDSITPQILIEAKLIETALSNSEKLGIDWETTVTATGASRKTTWPFDPTEVGESKGMRNIFPPGNFSTTNPYSFPEVTTGDFTFGALDFTSVRAIFDFLKTRQDTKLIANPRIVTLNNQKATIHVGKAIPIANYEVDENTGQWMVTGWEDEPQKVGVTLEVTPQINPDGYIRLKLKPEISDIFGWIEEGGKKLQAITTTREVETEVQVKDGQTVVIGGLIKNKASNTVKKFPILGDIPILGFFFTRREIGTEEDPREQTDLLIFVTATIIKATDEPLIAWEHNLVTSPARPFKLETREINIEKVKGQQQEEK